MSAIALQNPGFNSADAPKAIFTECVALAESLIHRFLKAQAEKPEPTSPAQLQPAINSLWRISTIRKNLAAETKSPSPKSQSAQPNSTQANSAHSDSAHTSITPEVLLRSVNQLIKHASHLIVPAPSSSSASAPTPAATPGSVPADPVPSVPLPASAPAPPSAPATPAASASSPWSASTPTPPPTPKPTPHDRSKFPAIPRRAELGFDEIESSANGYVRPITPAPVGA